MHLFEIHLPLLSRGVPISFHPPQPSHRPSSPVVNLELPRSSTAATHYVVRRPSPSVPSTLRRESYRTLLCVLGPRPYDYEISFHVRWVTLHARLCTWKNSAPFSSSLRSEGGIRKLLFSRRCRRLIKMVNCLRGGNDDKEGKRRKGQSVFAGFLGRFSFSPSARVTWDSSFVRRCAAAG